MDGKILKRFGNRITGIHEIVMDLGFSLCGYRMLNVMVEPV
jgi:hypothetical protein